MKNIVFALFCLLTSLSLGAANYSVECEKFPASRNVRLFKDELAQNGAFLHFTEENAETTARFDLPQSGDYALWARTMSFGGNFRKIDIYLNGKKVASLGDGTPENNRAGSFTWYHAPALTHLEAGELEIKLVSTSPYTRVDALIFTTDTAFLPEGIQTGIEGLSPVSNNPQKDEK